MRTFAALDISDEARKECGRLIESWKHAAGVRWTAPSNLHITLRFFGQTSAESLESLRALVADVGKKTQAFFARLGKTGAFPDTRRPRVLWADLAEGEAAAAGIAADLEEGARRIGFAPEERVCVPHVTLGRVGAARAVSAPGAEGPRAECRSPRFHVDSIVLYKSTLTSEGSVYEVLEKGRLA